MVTDSEIFDNTNKDCVRFLSYSLTKAYSVYVNKMEDCKKKFSERAVHDFRVSCRRFISTINLALSVFDSKYLPKIMEIVRNQFKLFGNLRDTQVQILTLQNLRHIYPELNAFYYELLSREENYVTRLKESIKGLNSDEAEGFFYFAMLELKNVENLDILNCDSFFDTLRTAYNKALIKKGLLKPQKINTIHKLRIAFKKFRYMAEAMQPINGLTDVEMKKFGAYQTLMGVIQDQQTLVRTFKEYKNKQCDIPERAFIQAEKHLSENLLQLVSDFLEKQSELESFAEMSQLKLNIK